MASVDRAMVETDTGNWCLRMHSVIRGDLRVKKAPAKGTMMVTHKESVMPDRDKWAGRFMEPKPDSAMKLSVA